MIDEGWMHVIVIVAKSDYPFDIKRDLLNMIMEEVMNK